MTTAINPKANQTRDEMTASCYHPTRPRWADALGTCSRYALLAHDTHSTTVSLFTVLVITCRVFLTLAYRSSTWFFLSMFRCAMISPPPPPTLFFFLNDPATPEIYPLPLHDALPI